MCTAIVDFEGDVIDQQGQLESFLGYPVTMRADAPASARHADNCLCWVDLDASVEPTGFHLVSAWESHGVDYRLERTPSPTPSDPTKR